MENVRRREKLKNGLLIGLVLLSFMQVGIHWNRQIQAHPFRLLSSWVRNSNQEVVDERLLTMRKASYITPVRISVSDEVSTRWQLDPSAETWNAAWTDLRQHYLPLLVTGKPDKAQPRAFWEQLLSSRRLVLFEFAAPVPSALLPWISDKQGARKGILGDTFPDMEQIAFVPSENVNATVNTLYVLSSTGVYRFTLSVPSEALPKSWYVMAQQDLDTGNNRQMALIAAKYGLNTVRRDTLVLDDEIPLRLSTYEMGLPAALSEEFSPENLQPLQESVLLNRKDSLLTRLDERTGDVTFSDMENVFRVSKQGLMTYRYMPEIPEASPDMMTAFRQAIAFLDERRRLLGDAELVLTGVTTDEFQPEAHAFSFSYLVDGQLVLATELNDGQHYPVSVTATAERVIACDWLIRQFSPVSADGWSVFFYEMYNDAVQAYPEITRKQGGLTSVRTGYRFAATQTAGLLLPEWYLQTEEDIRILSMRKVDE